MHGCLVLVNAGVDSMGGVIDGGVEVSSAPSPHQSSDLEKTQAELRETFTTAEKFRRELEFLQKGGDPLDLKVGTAASVSLQSTSLTDQHPEQFVTSEVKGSFAATASPHGDSVESSGRLGGALSVGEPNSADNLMLFDGNNNKSVSGGIELPEKSYKRRIRSRPNRHGSRDTKGLVVVHNTADNHDHKNLSNSNSTPKSPNNVGLDLKNLGSSNTHLDIKSNGTQETPLSMSSEKETLSGVDAHMADDVAVLGQRQTDQSLDGDNKNEVSTSVRNVDCNGSMELDIASKEAPNMEGNDVNTVKDDINNNEIGPTLKEEEGLKGSESALTLHDLKKSVCCTGSDLDGCTTSDIDKKPLGTESTTLPPSCSIEQNNLKLATKEHEDSILEEARIIEEKRKRIAGLSALIPKSESNHRSHWSFVLEEMSWLANDFAQERLWKVTASAQISKKAAYSSRVRFQQQKPLWEQKSVAHTLSESVMEFWNTVQVKCKEMELEESKKDSMTGLDEYGKRFLEYNNSSQSHYSLAQAPVTPDRISDLGITDISWEDNLTEESLFYMVPPGAIEAYRKSIESHLLQSERTGSSMQEDVDAIGYDDVADNTLEEEEGETSTYYLPGAFEGSRMLSKPTQKKRKHGQQFKSYIPRSYDTGADMSFPQSLERNMGKRPGTSVINVSIPTKRVRTASRPRFIGSGYINNNSNSQAPNRADASSGDTNSFQDEQSGYQIPQNNNMEAESVGDYEKQLHFDMTEVSNRPKKKKKGPTFDHRWQHDSGFQNDQKEHSKRRLDTRQFDSNGNSVGSQMSNMSNPNKFMKLLVRDRGRKAKSLKTPIGHQGSGSPWSLFEDQALVVLVHDMGANWELISDAINSTLQFKCISRNSKECKERHKILMDRSSGDGADSAEDSGSSQPYPSTLPGIPEGSARQLFQRLQGPMEEDTLKSHFEKIIVLSRKLHLKKSQKDNQDPKQLQQPHGSHALALSQVCPNNLNGGPVLTPLDLCEPITPTPDFLPVGYQVPHTSSAPSSSVFGKPNPNPNSPSVNVREGRYGIPRIEDQQHRMQQYNQMMSARNMQQQPTASSGPHSVRMLPGGNGNNGMGVMSAMNRGMMMMPRPPLSSNSVRSRDPPHMIRNQEGGSGTSPGPGAGTGTGTGMGNFTQPPPVPPYPMSPHHLPTTTNPQHPAFGMQMLKERQRLRQQQFAAAAASNPAMPRGQPVPSSPQQSQSPVGTNPPVTQHLQKPGPVGGVVRSPQGVQRRPPQQFQPPPGGRQQLAAVSKGGGASGVTNGFVAEHHLVQSSGGGGGGNLYSGPSGLNPTSPLIQKRFPGQSQPQQQKSKLMNPSQMTPAQKIILQNRKAAGNSSELLLPTATNTTSTSAKTKLQARGLILTKPPSSDDVAAADRKKSEAEAAKQSSSDNSLKPSNNSNSDSGVQWQKQQPSS